LTNKSREKSRTYLTPEIENHIPAQIKRPASGSRSIDTTSYRVGLNERGISNVIIVDNVSTVFEYKFQKKLFIINELDNNGYRFPLFSTENKSL
jgi:hypothetical protein